MAVALPTKVLIHRLFELSNKPCGYEHIWLHNDGISKKLVGKLDWHWANPEGKARRLDLHGFLFITCHFLAVVRAGVRAPASLD